MIYISKAKPGFDQESAKIRREAIEFLQWDTDTQITVFNCYEITDASQTEFQLIKTKLLSDNVEAVDFAAIDQEHSFRYRQIQGQYNEHEQMLQSMINNVLGLEKPLIHHSKIVYVPGVSQTQLTELKNYLINPVENQIIAFDEKTPAIEASDLSDLQFLNGFVEMTEQELEELAKRFSMDADDLLVCQKYFQAEGRDPRLLELKVIDTYWSDHCRHTTFNTHIDNIEISEGEFTALYKLALEDYLAKRKELNREDKAVTLMDLGTIQAKYLREKGILNNVEISSEVNASALEIKVDVDGKDEDWILYFKNETHNHPTEIEPFGGASTCIGGAIRDPLSGRSVVYQAMRVSGARNPLLTKNETHKDKLPQRVISEKALEGYSDYANQYGLASTYAEELYHPGFEAKRMEAGGIIAAAPVQNVVRGEAEAGDKILLLGGNTGRDGLGAAVGSSQMQTEESLKSVGAEVQKGAAAIERKFARLFRRAEAARLIKKCNDFGAGGVAVCVGELADSLDINLNKVPVKYPGMNGGEIALSESQERMAVVVAEKDLAEFLQYAEEEDVQASVIADVTNSRRMQMYWNDELIIDLGRDLLDSNGAVKHENAYLQQPEKLYVNDLGSASDRKASAWTKEEILAYASTLNRAGQGSMAEQFDATVGRATVLYPYGGKNRRTKELGMVSKLPVAGGKTTTVSGMAFGYEPYLSEESPFHGSYYAVVESVSRMVALGFNYKDVRLSFQEFFESLQNDPELWGKPVLALLGANLAMDGLELASIGGKDSMSGSFEELSVPPTLISFAASQGKISNINSRAFKQPGSKLVFLENPFKSDYTIDLELEKQIYTKIFELSESQDILAISTVGFNGLLKDLLEMSYGNNVGFTLRSEIADKLVQPKLGGFILELDAALDIDQILAGLPYVVIGETEQDFISIENVDHSLTRVSVEEVYQAASTVLASVYEPTPRLENKNIVKADKKSNLDLSYPEKVSKPKALIPVIYGTNGEYDLQYALEKAGFETRVLVLKDSSKEKFAASVKEFVNALADVELLALPNGASYGNQPDMPAKIWDLILTRDEVKAKIQQHLAQKRLIIGVGTACASLLRTGLIQYGEIRGESDIKVLPNKNKKFISDLLTAKVVSNASAFSQDSLNETYLAPVASAYLAVELGKAEAEMRQNGQVISEFEDYVFAAQIDALTSPDGLVLGTVSAFDRADEDLYKNYCAFSPAKFLENAYKYFQK